MKKLRLPIVALVLLLALSLAYLAYLDRASLELLRSALAPGAGERQSLVAEVIVARKILALAKIEEFDLAPSLSSNAYFRERLVEFAYPIRLRAGAKLVLAPRREPGIPEPSVLLRSDHFTLYERSGE